MQRYLATDLLVRVIARYGEAAMSSRQVAKRLRSLLPLRFSELKREHRRRGEAGAAADRQALTDQRFTAFVDELTAITFAAHQARIEYETHAMLYKARQSLRSFNAQRSAPGYASRPRP